MNVCGDTRAPGDLRSHRQAAELGAAYLVRVQESPLLNCCSFVWLYPRRSGFHNQEDNVGAANLKELG